MQKGAPFGVGVEYALHCLLYLIEPPENANLRIRDIAQFQGISETYLAKVFVRLKKAGIVRSAPGVNGGYELARPPHRITFLDVVEAVEGPISLFECRNIRTNCILYHDGETTLPPSKGICAIHAVMLEAEAKLRDHLREKTLSWLHESLGQKLPTAYHDATRQWFRKLLVE